LIVVVAGVALVPLEVRRASVCFEFANCGVARQDLLGSGSARSEQALVL